MANCTILGYAEIMLSAFVISQILIGIAFLFDLASFQFKRREYTVACFSIAASLIAAHYFFLDQHTAALVTALSAARFAVSVFTTDYRFKYAFIAAITVTGMLTYDEPLDLLIIAAGYLSTFAVFQPNEKLLRQLMLLVTSLAILFNILIFTPVGIFVETFFLGSNLLSYWRFYLKKPPES